MPIAYACVVFRTMQVLISWRMATLLTTVASASVFDADFVLAEGARAEPAGSF